MRLNHEKIHEYASELEKESMYIPILIQGCLDTTVYYQNQSKEAKRKFMQVRNGMPRENADEYFLNDVKEWVEQNPKYKDIILE